MGMALLVVVGGVAPPVACPLGGGEGGEGVGGEEGEGGHGGVVVVVVVVVEEGGGEGEVWGGGAQVGRMQMKRWKIKGAWREWRMRKKGEAEEEVGRGIPSY